MARKKGVKNKPKEAHAAVEPEKTKLPEPVVSMPHLNVKSVVFPIVDGIQVVKVLEDGQTKTHYHCEGIDRNGNKLTMHVLRNLFA